MTCSGHWLTVLFMSPVSPVFHTAIIVNMPYPNSVYICIMRFNDCFLGDSRLAKNLIMIFLGRTPTLLQDLCSTGEIIEKINGCLFFRLHAITNAMFFSGEFFLNANQIFFQFVSSAKAVVPNLLGLKS